MNPKVVKIAYLTLGCKLNFAETSTYRRGFESLGMQTVPWESEAVDAFLINTCSVTTHAENKCRNIIRKCHRRCPEAAIIVTGCYAELSKEDILSIEGVSLVFKSDEKGEVVSRSAELLLGEDNLNKEDQPHFVGDKAKIEDAEDKAPSLTIESSAKGILPAWSFGDRTRSFLKVQDGCDNFCAYCSVPMARGRSRNLPIAELVCQAEKIAAGGGKEIVLTGVNTGDFGRSTGESFLDLLKALSRVEGISRYRISSIEPNLITHEIVDWIADESPFLPHFHIPLQSGSDTILKAMGRRYTTDLFADRISYIRSAMEGPGKPRVFFGIDVITGLPGETEELFEETYSFLSEVIHPAFLHVFPYSPRPGTRAWKMPSQVQDSIKTERAARLQTLSNTLQNEFILANKGVREKVLWESSPHDSDDGPVMSGYTGNYIRLERPFDPLMAGTIEDVII